MSAAALRPTADELDRLLDQMEKQAGEELFGLRLTGRFPFEYRTYTVGGDELNFADMVHWLETHMGRGNYAIVRTVFEAHIFLPTEGDAVIFRLRWGEATRRVLEL